MHLLYIRMTRKEIYLGLGWLAVLLLSGFLFPAGSGAVSAFLFQGAHFLAAMVIFHRFLRSSLEVPLTPFSRILKSALLGLILAQLANLLISFATGSIPAFPFPVLILMIAGGISGGIVGRSINKRISEQTVDKLFIALMAFIIVLNGYNIYQFMI